MVKNSNKQFYWEDITIPNKRMKKVFNTTDNQESTRVPMSYQLIPVTVAAIRQTPDDD